MLARQPAIGEADGACWQGSPSQVWYQLRERMHNAAYVWMLPDNEPDPSGGESAASMPPSAPLHTGRYEASSRHMPRIKR